MAYDDPFTFNLFGSTAQPFGLGVTAFTANFADDADHGDPVPVTPTPTPPGVARTLAPSQPSARGADYHLLDTRGLAKSWRDRASDNLAAIRLAARIADEQRPATVEEQVELIRFTGFGASELANGVFRRPGEAQFRAGWDDIGTELETLVDAGDYASLARCTQYAHFTPEYVIRAIWVGLQRLGWRGGRVLEPGIGTGLFAALMPEQFRDMAHLTGIEIDPVTARIAQLLHPSANIHHADFARTELPVQFDLAIGNPPFSDRIVRSDRAFRAHALRLHDYFIVKAIDRLKPGGLAAFVTSSGTLDKADARAREHIASMADLIAAIRLPEGSFRADAGTDVVVDILFFRKRRDGEARGDADWLDLTEIRPATEEEGALRVNRWFATHPDLVLGTHALTSGAFGEAYTCLPHAGVDLEAALAKAMLALPVAVYDGEPEIIDVDADEAARGMVDRAPETAVREGSYFIGKSTALMQMVEGQTVTITIRKGRGSDGLPEKHTGIIRKLIPIRDAVRDVLKAQDSTGRGSRPR